MCVINACLLVGAKELLEKISWTASIFLKLRDDIRKLLVSKRSI